MRSMINENQVRKYIRAKRPDVRYSAEFTQQLEAKLRTIIDRALTIPSNRKTVKEIMP